MSWWTDGSGTGRVDGGEGNRDKINIMIVIHH